MSNGMIQPNRRRKAQLLQALALTSVAFLLSISGYSQGSSTGRILGAVTDQTGGVVAGATVTVTDTQRGTTRTLTTDDAGEYNAPELIPGTYTIRAEFRGFKATERQNLGVEVGKEYRVDITLEPGEQTEKVTVTEALPLVETTSAVLGGTISNQLIGDLPVQGRNFQKLLELRPGVYLSPGSGKWSQSSNGMRHEHNVYILNGIDTIEGFSSQSVLNASPVFGDATSILPIEAIQEFNTEQVPKAEYGWKPGTIVNVGLKSGTNSLHGTAYAFGRDDALDATNPFIQAGTPKQTTAIEDFGGTVGGPIVKDKVFFLFGYEGQRNSIGAPSSTLTLPTRADLVGLGIPAATANAQSVLDACNALAKVPSDLSLKISGLTYNAAAPAGTKCAVDANNPGVFQNGTSITESIAPIGTANLHNGLAKIDYHLNDKHTLSGEYFAGDYAGLGPQNNAAAQAYWDTFTHAKSMVAGFHWTWLLSSTKVNEARFGFNRENQQSYPGDCSSVGQPDYSYLANFNNNSTPMTGVGLPANCGFPVITISGGGTTFSSTGCCGTFPKIQGPDRTLQFIDGFSYIRGRHSFKLGYEMRHLTYNGGTYNGTRGSFTFNNTAGAGGATALQNFLTGTLSSTTLPSELVGDPARSLTDWGYAAYAQDDWRLTDRLMLNLGLRYETVTPPTDANNLLANFDPNLGLVQIGSGISSLWKRPNDFSPRLGFAWDIQGNAKWVLRGGASLIYVLEGFNVFVSQQASGASLGVNAVPTGALLNGAPNPNGGNITTGSVQFSSGVNWSIAGPVLPSGTIRCDSPLNAAPNNKPCSITVVDPNLKRPYAPAWNLSLQHAISNDLSIQVAYVGTHGTDLLGLNDINAPALGSGWLNPATNCSPYATAALLIAASANAAKCENISRPFFGKFPYLSGIVRVSNQDVSNYNGLQVTVTQRPWHGLSYLLGYTWSHALDEASGDWNGSAFPSNLYNVRADYGNSIDDVRHRATLSLTYALPEKKGFAHMLEGWKINSVANIQSALPWFVNDTNDDISGVGGKQDRWNFFGSPADFSGLGYASVPFFAGATNSACVSQAAALDAGSAPLYPGYTYSNALAKFGCYNLNGSLMLPSAFGTYGTMPRGLFRGTGLKLLDMSLTKDTKFSERFSGQFRFEVFNILNITQYSYMASATTNPASSTTFGSSRVTPDVQVSNPEVGSGAARSIQLGFKLTF
jgi:Carboxypeptidase regulatory-like domain/TonB dependent receptor